MEPVVARKNWRTLEPLHGFVYFAPEAHSRFTALGLEGQQGYFASRSAPMGPVEPAVTVATFFNFRPGYVVDAMTGVWDLVGPEAVLEARRDAVDEVLTRVLGDAVAGDEMRRCADLLARVGGTCDCGGRPLAAGHQSLERPVEPHLALWHDLTVVREFRGDGHIAALVGAGLSGLDALILHAASGEVGADVLRSTRAWSADEWAAGIESLAERGLVTSDGKMTTEGAALRQRLEDLTDELALPAWRALTDAEADDLRRTARPWSKALMASGAFG